MSSTRGWYASSVFASVLRLALFFVTSVPAVLERRPELTSPLTSFRSLREGVFLYQQGANPYDGGVFHHSPLYLFFCTYLLPVNFLPLTTVCWTLADVFAASCLVRTWKIRGGTEGRSGLVAALYLFNPYILLSCLSRSTVVFDNAMTLAAIASAAEGDSVTLGIALAISAHSSLYPLILLPALLQLVGKSGSKTLAGTTCVSVLILLAGVNTVCFGQAWLHRSWGTIMTVPDLAPNVGMWWYFFTEMFDHFRNFFLGVFQLSNVIYIVPICLRLKHDPLFGVLVTLGITSTWKSYPTLGDIGAWAGLLGCFPEIVSNLRHPLFTLTVHLYTSILLPLLHSLWLLSGTGNANFFYAATMVYGLNMSLAVVDVLSTGLRIDIKRKVREHVVWEDRYDIVQLTSVET